MLIPVLEMPPSSKFMDDVNGTLGYGKQLQSVSLKWFLMALNMAANKRKLS